MIVKRKYIDAEELVELIALTGVLPGPSSTQTIISIAYKLGGPSLGFLTAVIWILPALIFMILLSFAGPFLLDRDISTGIFNYISPMAVAFVIMAAYNLSKKVIVDRMSFFLALFGTLVSLLFVKSYIYPLGLIVGGVVSIFKSKLAKSYKLINLNPPWLYLKLFMIFALGSYLLNSFFTNNFIYLFYNFYKYGYLVIGGGQVVIPMMYSDLVEIGNFMTSEEFLIGYGLVQGVPGPMFSFSGYVGGLASRGQGVLGHLLGGLISGIAIFLPGILLIYFVYPIWDKLRELDFIKSSLKGIVPVASGYIISTAIKLLIQNGSRVDFILVSLLVAFLLWTKKLPAPFIVILTLILGFIFN